MEPNPIPQLKIWIPDVPKSKIRELFKRIKPVVRMARVRTTTTHTHDGRITFTKQPHPRGKWQQYRNGELYYIKPVDLFGIAYTWDPRPASPATNLKTFGDITTYHTYGYHGFFKPSIAEVLAQIPAQYLKKVIAFEIVKMPETAADLNREHGALNAGYHVATTRLYVRK